MNTQTDQELLQAYATSRSEPAFAELVRRHIDLVYSAALRRIGDPHLAQDVTQGTFAALAQNARSLTSHPVLSGWLHRTTQNIAANLVRSNIRRQVREQEAVTMNELLSAAPDASWQTIAPHLDAALDGLEPADRDAVMLRYFEKKSASEMAIQLGISDEAAQKRVSRAVERLREFFAKRGVTVGASGLTVVISANAVQAAPVGLSITISTAAVLTGTTLATTATITATKAIAMTALQKTIITATIAAIAGAGIYEARQASQMRDQVQTLQQQQTQLRAQIQQLEHEHDDAKGQPLRLPPVAYRSMPVDDQSTEDRQSTNLFARLMKELPKLSSTQVEPYLQMNARSAESLLAAFRATDDRTFLLEAMEKYPNDPRVGFMAYYRSEPNNLTDAATPERRQWLESFKQSAPDNALPVYLSARDHFKAGKAELALQEIQAGASKRGFQDYTLDFIQNTSDAYEAAGYSDIEAKAIGSSDIRLKHFTELRFLGRDLDQLAESYKSAGDITAAQVVLDMALNLGKQLDQPRTFSVLQQAVAIEIQRNAIRAMDANNPDTSLQQQLELLNQQAEKNRASQQRIDSVIQALSEQDLRIYIERTCLFGEEAARQWALSRHRNQ